MALGEDPAEIRHLPWQVRHRLLRAAGKRMLPDPAFWSGFLAGIIVLSILINSTLWFLWFWVPWEVRGVLTWASLGFFVLFFPSLILQFRMNNRRVKKALQEEMREQGIRPGICFECGADLASTDGDTCPQCDALLVSLRGPTQPGLTTARHA